MARHELQRRQEMLARAAAALDAAEEAWTRAGRPQTQFEGVRKARRELSRLRAVLWKRRCQSLLADAWHGHLEFVRVTRRAFDRFGSRTVGVVLLAGIIFALVVLLSLSTSVALSGVLVLASAASATTALVIAYLLLSPRDAQLVARAETVRNLCKARRESVAIADDEYQRHLPICRAIERLHHLAADYEAARDHVALSRRKEAEAVEDAGRRLLEFQEFERYYSDRTWLLAKNWRAMTGIEFEQFLRGVLTELGYDVEVTKASGDQGVDLIAVKGPTRIAIQAKGYSTGSVGNGAVQEVFAGMRYYRCNRCVVITNSRFTSSACDLAKKVGCQLIDGEMMDDLVSGRIL